MSSFLDQLVEKATRAPEVIKREEERLRVERTVSKYKNTQLRMEEIDQKISRLLKEKENLERKQQTRLSFLSEQKEK